jgi:MFS transporter, putative metabolite:H+ symporter
MKNRAVAFLIIVSALGYFVDAFDLLIFSVVRKASLADLGVSSADSLSVGLSLLNWQMAGLLLGGVLFGMVGDRRGRLAVLFGSILLYSLANLANAFISTIGAYKALRFLAGFGLAGELGAGVAIVTEVMSAKNRGIGTMIVATCGLLGAAVASIVGTMMPWRTAFIVGGVMGLVLLILRIGVAESELFRKIAATQISRGNFFSLFTSLDRLKRYMLCIGVGLPTYFVVGLLVTGAPEFGKTLGLTETPVAGTAVLLCYLSMSFGDIVCSLLSQKLKSRRLPLAIFNGICLAAISLYLFAPPSSLQGFYFRCALMGFGCGFWALVATNAAEQFGTNLRATVATSVPNFIRGALIPITFLYQQLKPSVGLITAAAIVGIGCALLGIASALASRETFAKDLDYTE